MLRYAKTEYPEMMYKLKIDTIANVIDIMFQNGNSLFSDNREKVVTDKEMVSSDEAKVRSNEMGYATNALLRQPVVLVPMPMLSYSRNRPLMVPLYNNYHSNYKWNYNARPSLVENSNTNPHFDDINSYLRKENATQTKQLSPTSSTTKNNFENHKMDTKPEEIIKKARALNNPDSSVMYVGTKQFGDDVDVQTNDLSNETSESIINEDFKTILLEGLGIDPKSIKKWSPVYCGTEYVVDVFKRADQINKFGN